MEEVNSEKVICNLSITNDTLRRALIKLIGWENESIVSLLHGIIAESHKGAEMFMRLSMGEYLPVMPHTGLEVYVPLSKLGWNIDEKEWRDSPFNENGFIKCVVVNVKPIHHYGPIEVELPKWDKYPEPLKARIDVTDYTLNDGDFYEHLRPDGPPPL